ncbi:MAG: replicative DNA helicase, partial [Patescibacteria group bacterium]
IDELHRQKGKLRGVPTGFPALDNVLAGLQKSDLVVLAARPSVGKTSLALDIARHVAVKEKIPVGIFSLEMSKDQLVDRLLCAEAQVDLWRMRTGRLSDRPEDDDFPRIGHAMGVLSEAPIFIDDSPNVNIMQIRAKARRLQSEHGLGLIMVDYLQLMESRNTSQENRVQEVAEITRGLKGIARELSVPVLALSQLARAVEMSKPAIPKLSHLRESGCLTGDTLIMHAKTGELMTMESLARRPVQKPIPVYSLDDQWRLVIRPMINVFSSGRKKVFELRMRSGRTLKASANHPFRRLDGWYRLDQLTPGDAITLPRQMAPTNTPDPLTSDELALLAHMLGDGCIVKNQPIHYTSADQENLQTVANTAERLFGIHPRLVRQQNWWHLYLPSPYNLARGRHHPMVTWLKQLGSGFAHSYEKTLPHAVFMCSSENIAFFLRHLWATDGNLSWKRLPGRKPAGAIYYATSSQILAVQVQHLLMRLGIQSTLRTVTQDSYRTMYQIHIQGAASQRAFLERVGCAGARGALIPVLEKALATIQLNPNTDIVPAMVWKTIVTPAKIAAGMGWRDVCRGIDTAYCGSTLFKAGVGRERLMRLAHACRSKELSDLATSDVYWDTIQSITPLDVQEVYDATVEDTHNFVANDIIVHNSIEQDADVVLFIYRKSADRNYRLEDIPPDERRVAEIHIAKHRNGPTGLVRMIFDEERASFRSLDTQFANVAPPPALPAQRVVVPQF